MIIEVKVIPQSSVNKIVEKNGNFWKVKLTAPAIEGRANEQLIEFLADELGIKKRNIKIISGERSRNKKISLE